MLKTLTIITCIFIWSVCIISAQQTNWTYIDQEFSRVLECEYSNSGDIIILGNLEKQKSLISLDKNGSLKWERTLDVPSYYNYAFNVAENNEILLVNGTWDSLIIQKIDINGNIVFQNRSLYVGNGDSNLPKLTSVIDLDNGAYLVGGQTQGTLGGFGNYFDDLLLIKIDKNGMLSQSPWISSTRGSINHMTKDPFGDIIIIGTFLDTLIIDDIELYGQPFTTATTFITKVRDNGEVIWAKTSTTEINGFDLQVYGADCDFEGNIYLAGERAYNSVIQKINSNGELLFEYSSSRYQGSYGYAKWYDIAVNNFGEIYVCGILADTMQFDDSILITSNREYHDFIFASYDQKGNIECIQKSNGLKSDRLFSILPSYSSFIVAGEINGEDPKYNPSLRYANLYVSDVQCRQTNKIRNCRLLNVFPNPSNGEIWIEFNDLLPDNNSVKIYNAIGQFLGNFNLIFDGKYARINIEDFPRGVYLIQMNNEKDCGVTKLILD